MSSQQENRQSKKIDLKTVIIFAVIFILIVAVGVLTFVLVSNKPEPAIISENGLKIEPNVITGSNNISLEERLAEMQKKVDEGSIGVRMETTLTFETGDSKAVTSIENPARNTYPFVVAIVITDTKEEVYRSGLIPPDSYINEVKLNTTLEKGSYPATAFFEVYNDAGEMTGKTGINITIDVLN